MPTNRKLLGAAAFSLALAGGGVAGALLGTPGLSGAQDGTDDTTEATAAEDAGRPGFGDHRGESLDAAAAAIGITADELRTALEGGQSIAQVAEANDVDVQTVIDALVADATERLEAAIDELPDRMAEVVEREGLPEHGHRGGPGGGPHGMRGMALDTAAEAIGITTDELRDALVDGSTIAEVAAANDVDVQTVIDALVAEANDRLDAAVAAGDLTEAEAAERSADLEERVTAHVNGERPAGPVPEPAADAA
jgi:hypothetical protein